MDKIKKTQILIVDNREEFRLLLNKYLIEAFPYIQIDEVADGDSALELIKSRSYDCVLINFQMADEAGAGLKSPATIREILPNVPVIVISAHGNQSVIKDIYNSAASSIISKNELSTEIVSKIMCEVLREPFGTEREETYSEKTYDSFDGLAGMSILLVDDSSTMLAVLKKIFSTKNIKKLTAQSGEEAIEIAVNKTPDLILMDIVMPGISGFETCEKLKANAATKDIPIIFMTSNTEPESAVKGFTIGGVDYVTKPFHGDEILARVKTHLLLKKNADEKDRLIQQLKEVSTDLSTNKKYLESITHNLVDGVIIIDRHGTVEWINSKVVEIFSYSETEIIGKNVKMLMPEPYKSNHDNYLNNYRNTGIAKVIGTGREVEGQRKDGSTFPVDLSLEEMLIEGAARYLGIVRDITERKESDKKILIEKAKAEKANKSKSEFLSQMSHDLRTPLNAILGFSQLLEINSSGNLTSIQKENIKKIKKSGNYLLKLINQLLDLARIEAGKIDLTFESVEIDSLIDEALSLAQPLAADRKITITKEGETHGRCILADRTRLKQVLLNLMSNAIKYNNPNGFVKIYLEDEGPSPRARIVVEDNGFGISDDDKHTIFESFSRLSMEKTDIEGTGIGLAISKQLVELMKGTLSFKSVLKDGSCFYIDLPVAESAHVAPKTLSEDIENTVIEGPETNATILYVEDDANNMELVRQALMPRKNITLIQATDANLGITLARSHDPDIILMDLNLPGINGIKALQILKNEVNSNIPVLAVSADAMEDHINKAIAAGFHDYIVKPINIVEFIDKIDKILIKINKL